MVCRKKKKTRKNIEGKLFKRNVINLLWLVIFIWLAVVGWDYVVNVQNMQILRRANMSELLKSAQAIFKLNSQWNKVIGRIKTEIIGENFELQDKIDEIVKEEFADEKSDGS